MKEQQERREADKIVDQASLAISFVLEDSRRSDPVEDGMAWKAGSLIMKNHAQETAVDLNPPWSA